MALKIFDKGSDSRPMLCEYDVTSIDAGWHGKRGSRSAGRSGFAWK